MVKKSIILFVITFALLAPFAYSNGGCVKVADDMLVQMSVAPHVPIANEKASFLFSFGNESGLIREEISGKIKIVQNGKALLENDFRAKDGILDLKHEFNSPGIYEIFLEFNANGKEYMPEDFVVEAVEKQGKKGYLTNVLFLLAGILVGVLSSKLFKLRK
ncbi:hypothetical protein HYS31_08225 [Candidatus Woesearchaeota archaeon]|nr:hypothetical protein [Candidatus Woesearchaeota archaeon]